MLAKFLWSVTITLLAMSAAYIDGERNYFLLTDQSLSLFFSGFGAIIISLVVARSTSNNEYVVEADPSRLQIAFVAFIVLIFLIFGFGQQRDPANPSYWISGFRTLFGTIALWIGLSVSECLSLKERADG